MRGADRSKTFTSIGQTLNDSGNSVVAEAASRYRALSPLGSSWQRAVEQPLREHAHPVALRDGVLTVHAESPVWANLIRNNEQSIVASLHEAGLADVRNLRIRIAPPQTSPDAQPAEERDDDPHEFSRLFEQLRKALD